MKFYFSFFVVEFFLYFLFHIKWITKTDFPRRKETIIAGIKHSNGICLSIVSQFFSGSLEKFPKFNSKTFSPNCPQRHFKWNNLFSRHYFWNDQSKCCFYMSQHQNDSGKYVSSVKYFKYHFSDKLKRSKIMFRHQMTARTNVSVSPTQTITFILTNPNLMGSNELFLMEQCIHNKYGLSFFRSRNRFFFLLPLDS